jgi:hypothetical protein
MVKRIICLVFLLGLLVSSGTLAQEKPELFVRVEHAFLEKEPTWKVERIYPGNTPDPTTQSIVLRSRSGRASVEISIWRRPQDAEDVFGGQSLAFDQTAGKKKVKRSLPGFGDESHIWTNRGSTAWPTMKFRKGSIVVSVFAPTVAIARKFAQYVLTEIDAG